MSLERYSRILSIIGEAGLARFLSARAVVMGAGTAASTVVDQLVRHGVGCGDDGNIIVVDGDNVELRNLIGTVYRESDVGANKAIALARRAKEINSDVNITAIPQNIKMKDIPAFERLAKHYDLVVMAFDSFDLWNPLADALSPVCPVVAVRFSENCDSAEIGFSEPGMLSLSATMGNHRHEAQTIHGAAALGTDTSFVTDFAASLSLCILLGEKGLELMPRYADCPLCIMAIRASGMFQDLDLDVARAGFWVKLRQRRHNP